MSMEKKGINRNSFERDYVMFDLETTGLDYISDRIVEIGAVKVVDGVIVDEFETMVNPECHISEAATQVNGITDDMVKDAPLIKEAMDGFLAFAGDMVLVGHNIEKFDLPFLQMAGARMGYGAISNDYVDTVILARQCMPEMSSRSLGVLAEHFGFDTKGAHRALADVKINQKVYVCLEDEMKKVNAGEKIIPDCPNCGGKMVVRKSIYGEFWGCRNYPACKGTRKII